MSKIKYGNFKIGCSSKRPEKNYKRFSYKFSLRIRSRNSDSVNGMPENVASRRILTKIVAAVFYRI